MKKEIVGGVIGALITALILWIVGAFDKKLTDSQLDSVANELASNLDFSKRIQAQLPASVEVDAQRRAVRIGEIQICWGQISTTHDPARETRSLTASFAKPFVENPRVTIGIHPEHRGGSIIAWEEFRHSITTTNYEGQLNGVGHPGADWGISVWVDYVAVGKWRE